MIANSCMVFCQEIKFLNVNAFSDPPKFVIKAEV